MKKFSILIVACLILIGSLTGCGCMSSDVTTTTQPVTSIPPVTTRPVTEPTRDMTMPSIDNLVPGPEDTIDATNGANNATEDIIKK